MYGTILHTTDSHCKQPANGPWSVNLHSLEYRLSRGCVLNGWLWAKSGVCLKKKVHQSTICLLLTVISTKLGSEESDRCSVRRFRLEILSVLQSKSLPCSKTEVHVERNTSLGNEKESEARAKLQR